jgi:FkbM family methyltransferase
MFASFTRRVAHIAGDLAAFGPGFVVKSNLARLRPGTTAAVHVPGIGPVHVRGGNSDVAVLRQVFGKHEYDLVNPAGMRARIQARYEEILAAGRKPIIVDAGANIGASALYFEQQFPAARIVSVEPDPANLEVLRKNVGHRPNHVIRPAAIGSSPGFVSLSGTDVGWAVQTERADQGLPIVTIEDAFAASGGDDPLLVKIDIEGFESDLFEANCDWVAKPYAIVIEPHDWMLPGKMTSANFQKALSTQAMELYIKGENLLYVRA